jgi:hypothetical protein
MMIYTLHSTEETIFQMKPRLVNDLLDLLEGNAAYIVADPQTERGKYFAAFSTVQFCQMESRRAGLVRIGMEVAKPDLMAFPVFFRLLVHARFPRRWPVQMVLWEDCSSSFSL